MHFDDVLGGDNGMALGFSFVVAPFQGTDGCGARIPRVAAGLVILAAPYPELRC